MTIHVRKGFREWQPRDDEAVHVEAQGAQFIPPSRPLPHPSYRSLSPSFALPYPPYPHPPSSSYLS